MSMGLSAKSKRSISTAISNLFKKAEGSLANSLDSNNNAEDRDEEMECESNTSTGSVVKRPRLQIGGELQGEKPPNQAPPQLILYESEGGNQRPPVLPILPLQRLRMLRYKQEIRRQQYQLVNVSQTQYRGEGSRILSDSLDSTLNDKGLRSIMTKLGNNQDNSKGSLTGKKGRLWSSNFEYDLSEYDVLKKQKTSNNGSLGIALDSPKLDHQNVNKRTSPAFDAVTLPFPSSSLSRTQMKLLNGSASELTMGGKKDNSVNTADKNASSSIPGGKDRLNSLKQTPSIGFDFLSNSGSARPQKDIEKASPKDDSASDKRSPGSHNTETVDSAKKTLALSGPGSMFSFGPTNGERSTPSLYLSNAADDSTPSMRKLGQLPEISTIAAHKDDAKHPSTAGIANTTTPSSTKPAFSFGNITMPNVTNNDTPAKDNESTINNNSNIAVGPGIKTQHDLKENVPKFTFGRKEANDSKIVSSLSAKTAATDSNTGGIFSSSAKQTELASIPATSKPAFTFGTSLKSNVTPPLGPSKVEEVGSLPFPTSSNVDAKSAESAPGLKFGKNESINSKGNSTQLSFALGNNEAAKKEDTSAPFTFGTNSDHRKDTTPKLFQLGTGSNKATESTEKSFTFGTTMEKNKDGIQKPFKFGSNTEESSSNQKSFTFGAAAEENGKDATKPFTFGVPAKSAPQAENNTAFTFGNKLGTISNKNDSSSTLLNGKPNNTNLFSFSAAPNSAVSNSLDGGSQVFGDAVKKQNITSSASAPVTSGSHAEGNGFKFDMSQFGSNHPPKASTPSFSPASGVKSSMGGGFGVNNGSTLLNAPQPRAAAAGFPFPQSTAIANNFGFVSGSTTSNNSPVFGNSANSQPAMGFNFTGSTGRTPSPSVFGGSTSPAYPPATNNIFTPSASVNMNFGGQTNLNPAQIFGQQAPSSGSNGGVGLMSTQQQPVMHIPPGRKIARMRARRG